MDLRQFFVDATTAQSRVKHGRLQPLLTSTPEWCRVDRSSVKAWLRGGPLRVRKPPVSTTDTPSRSSAGAH
eukprot:695819-Heterocapsa_arctica.AAC.1